jgi:putative zinc finger/helix-turn-helix YgiT family protein
MICLRCDNETFVAKPDAVIEQQFKGETLHVQTPGLACSKCGWVTVDAAQADELRRRTADAYRKQHGLLTSDAIRALRQLLSMNQRDFAAFVGVGEASVKRWETWLVQEKSSDELIRLKCDSRIREELAQKPTVPAWFCVHHHEAAANAPYGGTTQKEVLAETATPSRWNLLTDLDEQDESQMFLFNSGQPNVCGLSPPRCEEVAFSLSAPCLSRGRTLKKKMLTNLTIRN